MKKSVNLIFLFLVALLLESCYHQRFVPDFSNEIDYAKKVTVYSNLGRKKEVFKYEFYNHQDKLIETTSFEHRSKYHYDSIGNLQEIFECRIYNCDFSIQTFFVRDSCGNVLGSYIVTKEGTTEFTQTKFYDNNGLLVKELINSGYDSHGKYYECWKHYLFEDNRIKSDIEMRNNDTIWSGKYSYNAIGELVFIEYKNPKGSVKTEKFEYNTSGQLTKKTIEKDKLQIKENVSFDVDNNSIRYNYDIFERLSEETKYNHKDEIQYRYIYEYE